MGVVEKINAHTMSARPNTLQRRSNIQASWILSCLWMGTADRLRCGTLVHSSADDKLVGVKICAARVIRETGSNRRKTEWTFVECGGHAAAVPERRHGRRTPQLEA